MKRADIVVDLGFGDAGKGTIVDYLVRQANSAAVIRYNGGPQAAHNVVTPDGRHHTFAQWGSGTLVPGVVTYLSRDMLVNPLNMFAEAEHLREIGVTDAWQRLSVSRDARLITPWQQAANRLREKARGDGRHGSCAQGVGETISDWLTHKELVPTIADLEGPRILHKLERLRQYKVAQLEVEVGRIDGTENDWRVLDDTGLAKMLRDTYDYWRSLVAIVDDSHLAKLANTYDSLVFEGAQGVLLDEKRGFHPYTTWSNTTPENAHAQLADSGYSGDATVHGLLRAYTTRHGPGPFVTEDSSLAEPLREYHNGRGEWQGDFRYGHLDLVAHAYALKCAGQVDDLVVTGIDRMASLKTWRYCDAYCLPASNVTERFFEIDATRQARGIKLGTRGNLIHQARLTDLLQQSYPIYRSLSAVNGSKQLLEIMSDTLRIPIGLVSYGPTAADKRALVAC